MAGERDPLAPARAGSRRRARGWISTPGGRRVLWETTRRGAHALVTGPTGVGKSQDQKGQALQRLRAGERVVIMGAAKGHDAEDLYAHWLPVFGPRWGISPTDVTVFAPFKGVAVPLNFCSEVPGIPRDERAALVADILGKMAGEAFGPRMSRMLMRGLRVSRSLVELHRLLTDETFRRAVVSRIDDPVDRQYWSVEFDSEPAASALALAARLDRHVLALSDMRAMFNARGCLAGEALLGSRLTVLDLGGAPMGLPGLPSMVGSLLLMLLLAAVMSRPDRDVPVTVYLDEFHVLAEGSGIDLERALQLSREQGVGWELATQSLGALRNPALVDALLVNVATWTAFRPRQEDVRLLSHVLPESLSRMVDPEVPDRLLSPADARARWERRLRALPRQTALYADLVNGTSQVLVTGTLPLAAVVREAARVPAELRERYRLGRLGRRAQDLEAFDGSTSSPPAPAVPVADNTIPWPSAPARSGARRGPSRRPALELP
ncbi:hypothetical protein HY631_04490 [Candidatus Uhrbacteria bacterium]|nr:hypothetical protein [Candidatus Uhrbacteria bacterium]